MQRLYHAGLVGAGRGHLAHVMINYPLLTAGGTALICVQNSSLKLEIEPEKGWFNLCTNRADLPTIKQARLGVTYRLGRKQVHVQFFPWKYEAKSSIPCQTLEHGEMDQAVFSLLPDENGIAFQLIFAVTREYPLVLWKVRMLNQGNRAVNLECIEMLCVDSRKAGKVVFPKACSTSELGFYSNGWQSWSPSRWQRGDARMTISGLGILQHPMIYNPGTPLPRRRGVFSSDMFAVLGDLSARSGFVLGFLSQGQHFGSILADLNNGSLCMWANGDDSRLDPGGVTETDWAVFNPILLDHRNPMEVYLDAAGRQNHARVPALVPVGWCSWYYFYTKLTARNIEDNLNAIIEKQERLPVELVQIDDGFESQVGDWFSFKPGFPQGVAPLAEQITAQGFVPGLWLAPFIVHPKSELMRIHPDWILRRSSGFPANAGFVWNVLDTGLDLTVAEALEYACSVAATAAWDWGFPYLKLDFLYAAALKGRYQDPTQTRAQVLRKGTEAVREAVGPNVTLLGCGAPLGSMLGIVDLMRVGPDVSGDWYPKFHGISVPIRKELSFPCARNSIRNIISRASMHRSWWVNDPDCLLIRPDSNLTLPEVQTLATVIALTGGSLLLSDDLPHLPAERQRIAEALLPVLGERARVPDWFDSEDPKYLRLDLANETGGWHVLSVINWADKAASLSIKLSDYLLDGGEYVTREFWSGKVNRWKVGQALTFKGVPAHGCVLLAARRFDPGVPAYIGSDLHVAQGIEVTGWQHQPTSIHVNLRLPRTTEGNVTLYLPMDPKQVLVSDVVAQLNVVGEGFYTIPVQVHGFAHLDISW